MLSMDIDGLEALRARVDGMMQRTVDMEPALLRAGVISLDADKERIELGGPGWKPNLSGTPLGRRTGHMMNSLTAGATNDILEVSGDSVKAGTNVPYAHYFQGGTGIYGPGGQRIRSNSAGALSFVLGGRRVTVRSIAGSPPRPFVGIDAKVAETIRSAFAQYILGISDANH